MNNSLYNKCLTYDFETLFRNKGYSYFTKGIYNLNIIGVRADNNNKITNLYDDILLVIYNTPSGKVSRKLYAITTEPGNYYMRVKLGNPNGTAILVPGQYKSCWKIGKHKGTYNALCQQKPVKVYRDGNYDDIYDLNPKTIRSGMFGINIHRSNENIVRLTVDKYSAGCQVFNNPKNFSSFMDLCNRQRTIYGNSFTYTLIDEGELI